MTPERDTTTIELANARRYSEIASQYAADWRGKLDSEQQQNLDKFLSVLGEGSKACKENFTVCKEIISV